MNSDCYLRRLLLFGYRGRIHQRNRLAADLLHTSEVKGVKNVVRLSIERLEQRHCLYEIGRVEAFGEQAVDRRQDATGFGTATLLTEQAGEADCGA